MQYQLSETSICCSDFDALLNTIDTNSDYWRSNTSDKEKKRRGQHFTPLSMAVQLSVMSQPKLISNVSIADPGAGTGILSTALACKLKSEKLAETISFLGFETDSRLHDDLLSAWSFFTAQSGVENDISLNEDFTAVAAQLLATGEIEGLQKPSYITTNPPYNKLLSTSPLAKMLKDFGVPVSNLYAAFVILATEWLEDDSQLLAVLPRSFCSGIYFKKFRKYLMEKLSIEHITLYKSRSCFKNVLQENILICASKRKQSSRVRITVSEDPNSTPEYDLVLPSSEILNENFWALPRSINDIEGFTKNQKRDLLFKDTGLAMSTGKVELHRLSGERKSKVIYSSDFSETGGWTWAEKKKPRFADVEDKQLLDLPEAGGYVVLKRISSNDGESPQRLMPAWLSREVAGQESIALENHVQYIHKHGEALTEKEGKLLCAFLRSDEAQAVIRTINGTTQINKSDIESLCFPDF